MSANLVERLYPMRVGLNDASQAFLRSSDMHFILWNVHKHIWHANTDISSEPAAER